MPIQPAARADGYEASEIVRAAVGALAAFGGELTFGEARQLLPLWRYFRDLTEAECTAVLARFPRVCGDARGGPAPIQGPGNSGPGW